MGGSFVSGFCGKNNTIYRGKEVPYPGCLCYNRPEVKYTALNQHHCPLITNIRLFKDIVQYLHKLMKSQDTEPTIYVILCWYIRGKGLKLLQDDPHLSMKLSYAEKAQDNIGWDNMMRGQISRNWNNWRSDYL